MPPAAVIRSLLVFDEKHPLYVPYKVAKRIAIGIVGGSVLIIGVCMIVLPGPAFIVIPAGLAILGIEFAWARIWLKKAKAKAQQMAQSLGNRNGKNPPPTS
jgi:tellurite resistance protein TerC